MTDTTLSGVKTRRLSARLSAGLLAALCLAATAPAFAFSVGYFIEEPHAMVVDGAPAGAAVEYLRDHIAPAMGEPVDFVGPLPFRRLLHDFRQGRFDALLFLIRTPEREQEFIYPRTPYTQVESGLLARKGRVPAEVRKVAPLLGLRIGFTSAWRPRMMRDPALVFDLVNVQSATRLNFRKYREGRIDAVFNPDYKTLLYRLRRTEGLPPSTVSVITGTSEGIYTVFHPHTTRHLVTKYENALTKVRAALPYQTLLDRYMEQ